MKYLPERFKNQLGFTIPELLVVMGILAILFGLTTPNLLHFQQRAVVNTTSDILVNDLKSQQNKAMVGDTEGRGTSDNYGIYFESDKYTLFHGTVYDSMDTDNFVINLDPSISFTNITVPNSSIIFSKGSGEVEGYMSGSDTIDITDTTNGDNVTIRINTYGAIDLP